MAEHISMVKEEVESLISLTDNEIAERYVTNHLSQFPMTVVSKALDIVMKERKFKVKFDIKYHLDYIT